MHPDYSNLQPPDWDAIEKQMWQANLSLLNVEIRDKSPRLMKRIETFVWRFGYDTQTVLIKIQNDPMFAAHFAKEPRRQSPHENIAAQYLSQFPEISDFRRLNQSGNDAVYIDSDGAIRKGDQIQGDKPSKALDFEWQTPNGIRCLASHKYTREGGGNQDSQFIEQRNFLRNFLNRSTNGTALFVICDGPYFNQSRMNTLKQQARTNPPLSFAVHIEEVAEIMRTLDSRYPYP